MHCTLDLDFQKEATVFSFHTAVIPRVHLLGSAVLTVVTFHVLLSHLRPAVMTRPGPMLHLLLSAGPALGGAEVTP